MSEIDWQIFFDGLFLYISGGIFLSVVCTATYIEEKFELADERTIQKPKTKLISKHSRSHI